MRREPFQRRFPLVVALAIIVLFILRVALAEQPITRDEGAYAYIALRLMEGQVPYRDIWDHKPPAIYFAYATALLVIGPTPVALHVLAAIWLVIGAGLVYLVGRRLFGAPAGRFGCVIYAASVLTTDGTGVNTELFMSVCSLAGVYAFLRSEQQRILWLVLSGLCFGLAFMFKQVAAFDLVGILAYWAVAGVVDHTRRRNLWLLAKSGLMLLLGFSIALVPFVLFFWLRGALDAMWFDSFVYNIRYSNGNLRALLIDGVFATRGAFERNPLLWVGALASLVDIAQKRRWLADYLPMWWAVGSLLGIASPNRYFEHYYIQILAPLSLLAGRVLADVFDEIRLTLQPKTFSCKALRLLTLCMLGWAVLNWSGQYLEYFRDRYHPLDRKQVEVAEYVRAHTEPDEPIFIWGREPQVYFLAGRRSASKYINFYPMTRSFYAYPDAEARLMAELQSIQPRLILVELPPNVPPPQSLRELLDAQYVQDGVVGEMEIYWRASVTIDEP